MSTIAHLGQGSGRLGGPAGYLAQLDRAFKDYGTGRHRILLPPALPPRPHAAARPNAIMTLARRFRRSYFGAPSYARPANDDVRRRGGPIDALLRTSWTSVRDDATASLQQGLAVRADVLFAHDAPSAEIALEQRAAGQQVWVMLHTPMPLPLYLAWCWGVPERPWEEVAAYPDVQDWTQRELRAVGNADRVFIPCVAAAEDLTRACADFGPALSRAGYLLTGGDAPPRRRGSLDAARLRESFGLPATEPVAVYLGNPQPYRGLDALLEALPLLPRRGDLPGILAVAGCPPDRLPLHPRLWALGSIADVSDLLETSDFMVNTNHFSLFDLSLIEATAAGKPLLLHAVGGNRTFAQLGAGCWLIGDIRPATVAAAMAHLFRDSSARAEMAERSRTCWKRMLTPRHLRDRHIALYDEFSGGAMPRYA